MHTLRLARMVWLCGLCLFVACGSGSTVVSTARGTEKDNTRSLHGTASCKSSSECPSKQRCGFTGDEERGTCVVETAGACFDPGGRCGCDGQPVDLFCGNGSTTEFASAPVCFVGGCPISCGDESGCPTRLVCQRGFCRLPQNGEKRPKL